jgi:hypothetical protein
MNKVINVILIAGWATVGILIVYVLANTPWSQ